MKSSEIKVGKTYVNRGAGRTQRQVIQISKKYKPEWYGDPNTVPDEPGVLFIDSKTGRKTALYLSLFAQWAGREFKEI